jgi:hypothetical protein
MRSLADAMIVRVVLVAGVLLGGCDIYYDTTSPSNLSTTTWDETLPDALEEVFGTCVEPLTIFGGDDDIDIVRSCQLDDVSGEGGPVLLGLSAIDPIELDDPLPVELYDATVTISDQSFGVVITLPIIGNVPINVTCTVQMPITVEFDRVSLYNLYSDWRNRNGEPALYLDLDFDANQVIGTVEAGAASVSGCWVPWNLYAYAIAGAVNVIRPKGPRDIRMEGADLDLYITFSHTSWSINADLEVVANIDRIEVDAFLANVLGNGFEDAVLDRAGVTPDDMVGLLEGWVRDSLGSLTSDIEDLVEESVPAGERICDIEVTSGDLVVTSSSTQSCN